MEEKPKTKVKTYTEEQVKDLLEKNAELVADRVMQSYQMMMDRVRLYQSIIESSKYPADMVKFAKEGLWKIINPEEQCNCNQCACKEDKDGKSK